MNNMKCSRCGGGMIEGGLRVRHGLHFWSNAIKGFGTVASNKARACIDCGYVEMYLDPEQMKGVVPRELWPARRPDGGEEFCRGVELLKSRILKERKWGHTTFAVTERPVAIEDNEAITDVVDEFVENLGLDGLGEGWIEIDRRCAENIAQMVLHRDLAYNAEAMTAQRACVLAKDFLALFDVEAHYFTNGESEEDGLRRWTPLTEATFDTGIICVGTKHLGILWVQDED